MQEPQRRCHSLPIKAKTNVDQLSAWAPTIPSDLPASPVSSIYFKVECVCECCTWSLRSLLCPLLALVLRFPSQSGVHRVGVGGKRTLRQEPPVPSVLPLYTGRAILRLQSLSDLSFQRRVRGDQGVSTGDGLGPELQELPPPPLW